MWKCKNCGSIEFEAQVGSVVFDEMGVILEVGDISNEVYCLECSSVGNRIDGIAIWEE